MSETYKQKLPVINFDEKHRENILNGVKRSTLRYDPDYLPSIGEPFVLHDSKGDYLGTSICIERGYESLNWIVKDPILGHRRYHTVEECISEMQEYYPDIEFTPSTCVEIVYWGDLIGRKIEFDYR